jgi:hypothetical protein
MAQAKRESITDRWDDFPWPDDYNKIWLIRLFKDCEAGELIGAKFFRANAYDALAMKASPHWKIICFLSGGLPVMLSDVPISRLSALKRLPSLA